MWNNLGQRDKPPSVHRNLSCSRESLSFCRSPSNAATFASLTVSGVAETRSRSADALSVFLIDIRVRDHQMASARAVILRPRTAFPMRYCNKLSRSLVSQSIYGFLDYIRF